jgi:5-hydroxyisourate hydrolase-like protein (transthyretin family)
MREKLEMYCITVCVNKGEYSFMHVIGYCYSPLNNKNTNYHCPVVFSRIGFPCKSLCQLCD